MKHSLAGSRITLNYLQDRRALAGIDWPAVLDDLTDAGAPPNRCQWCDLDRLTHVVLATDPASGGYIGMLGLIERATSLEPYLLVEVVMVRPGGQGIALRRAMLAHILARVVCLDGKPVALASPPRNRSIEPALRDLGLHIGGSELHPPADDNVIRFTTASLARRIGPGGTVLDLRPVAEGSLLRDLRGLHGGRPERTKRRIVKSSPDQGGPSQGGPNQGGPDRGPPDGKPTEKSARSAAATRRPRKATRTGRSG